ncbi:MAG: hypothetical protein FRX49_11669 [Trebouxia sp. A1-2]|nr:MAG: hypothetical protein FRX49_11669 [Trebouxia sp. A1-2]
MPLIMPLEIVECNRSEVWNPMKTAEDGEQCADLIQLSLIGCTISIQGHGHMAIIPVFVCKGQASSEGTLLPNNANATKEVVFSLVHAQQICVY